MLATALIAYGREIRLASQMLPGAESHGREESGWSPDQTTVRRLRPLRRRLFKTLRPWCVAARAR
jgi:hypothetical protein